MSDTILELPSPIDRDDLQNCIKPLIERMNDLARAVSDIVEVMEQKDSEI